MESDQTIQPYSSGSRVTYKSLLHIILICANISLGFYYFGYCLVYLGTIPIETIMKAYSIDINTGLAAGLLNGCIPVGALLGALGCSFLISHFSRRKCMIIVNVGAMITGALIYIPSVYSLTFFRLLQGYWVGSFTTLGSLIIKELAPKEISGSMGIFMQMMLGTGALVAYFINYCLKKIYNDVTCQSFWHIVFAIPFITLTIQLTLLIFVFPFETPKYLLLEGKQEEARQLVQILYLPECVEDVLDDKKEDIKKTRRKQPKDTYSLLSDQETNQTATFATENRRSVRLTLLVGIHVALLQQFSGINSITVYCNSIAAQITTGQFVHLMSTFISLIKMLGTLIAYFLLSRFGRKRILVMGGMMNGLSAIMLALGFYLKSDEYAFSDDLVIIGLFMFELIYGMTLGPVVWLYLPEILQPRMIHWATATNWTGSALVAIFFPIITQNILNNNPWSCYLFFALWNIGAASINTKYLVETKDKSERQIREQYSSLWK